LSAVISSYSNAGVQFFDTESKITAVKINLSWYCWYSVLLKVASNIREHWRHSVVSGYQKLLILANIC